MMTANRIYQLALRAYPEPYRSECGQEVVHTAVELRDGRWSLRETLGLLKGGIRTRSIASTTGAGSSVWMSGLRLGLLFLAIDGVTSWIKFSSAFESGLSGVDLGVLAANILLLVAMSFSTGVAFATALTAVGVISVVIARADWIANTGGFPYQYLLGSALVLVATWMVALRSDGRRAASPLVLIAMVGAWFGVLLFAPSYTYGGIPFESIGQLLVLLMLGVVGVAVATLDPRLLAGTLTWLGFSTLFRALTQTEYFIIYDFAALLVTSAVFAAILGLGMRFGVRRLARV